MSAARLKFVSIGISLLIIVAGQVRWTFSDQAQAAEPSDSAKALSEVVELLQKLKDAVANRHKADVKLTEAQETRDKADKEIQPLEAAIEGIQKKVIAVSQPTGSPAAIPLPTTQAVKDAFKEYDDAREKVVRARMAKESAEKELTAQKAAQAAAVKEIDTIVGQLDQLQGGVITKSIQEKLLKPKQNEMPFHPWMPGGPFILPEQMPVPFCPPTGTPHKQSSFGLPIPWSKPLIASVIAGRTDLLDPKTTSESTVLLRVVLPDRKPGDMLEINRDGESLGVRRLDASVTDVEVPLIAAKSNEVWVAAIRCGIETPSEKVSIFRRDAPKTSEVVPEHPVARFAALQVPVVRPLPDSTQKISADDPADIFRGIPRLDEGKEVEDPNAYRRLVFTNPARFPLAVFDRNGPAGESEGLLIHESMELFVKNDGRYELRFLTSAPAVPVVLRLQFRLNGVSGVATSSWTTLFTLPPIEILPVDLQHPFADSITLEKSRYAPRVVRHVGYSAALKMSFPLLPASGELAGDGHHLERLGTAQFGYGYVGNGVYTRNMPR